MTRSTRTFAGLTLAFAAACAGESKTSDTTRAAAHDSGTTAAAPKSNCPGDNGGLTLATGFCATVFADTVGPARHIVVSSNGDVYATMQTQTWATGAAAKAYPAVVAMRDTNHDGVADVIEKFGEAGGTGIAIYNGYLYVDQQTKLERYRMTAGQLSPSKTAEVVLDGLPIDGDHKARNFVIGDDGALYVNLGSFSNSCQQKDRTPESPGKDPCVELETRAGIWKYDAKKLGQHFSKSARFATGIRNAVGLTMDGKGRVWTTQHGRDQVDMFASHFTHEQNAELPAEELMQVNKGDDFGWPYCYFDPTAKVLVTAPEYGGDGKTVDRCASKKAPFAWFPAHWAPMSALFYTGSMLPDQYKTGAFIAFHGSWNRAPMPQAGYKVVYTALANAPWGGNYETIADGFAGGNMQPDAAKHRPVGLAQAPDGALFISDDKGGRIWRVTWTGK